MATIASEA